MALQIKLNGATIELWGSSFTYDPVTGFPTHKEEMTAHEAEQFCIELRKVIQKARYAQKGIKVP